MVPSIVTTVIAIINATIIFTGFQENIMPRSSVFNPKSGDSALRIAVALNGGREGGKHFYPQGADGKAPGVLVYNPDYNYIGHSNWKSRPHIATGAYEDLCQKC